MRFKKKAVIIGFGIIAGLMTGCSKDEEISTSENLTEIDYVDFDRTDLKSYLMENQIEDDWIYKCEDNGVNAALFDSGDAAVIYEDSDGYFVGFIIEGDTHAEKVVFEGIDRLQTSDEDGTTVPYYWSSGDDNFVICEYTVNENGYVSKSKEKEYKGPIETNEDFRDYLVGRESGYKWTYIKDKKYDNYTDCVAWNSETGMYEGFRIYPDNTAYRAVFGGATRENSDNYIDDESFQFVGYYWVENYNLKSSELEATSTDVDTTEDGESGVSEPPVDNLWHFKETVIRKHGKVTGWTDYKGEVEGTTKSGVKYTDYIYWDLDENAFAGFRIYEDCTAYRCIFGGTDRDSDDYYGDIQFLYFYEIKDGEVTETRVIEEM